MQSEENILHNLCQILSEFWSIIFYALKKISKYYFTVEMCKTYSADWTLKENTTIHIILQNHF